MNQSLRWFVFALLVLVVTVLIIGCDEMPRVAGPSGTGHIAKLDTSHRTIAPGGTFFVFWETERATEVRFGSSGPVACNRSGAVKSVDCATCQAGAGLAAGERLVFSLSADSSAASLEVQVMPGYVPTWQGNELLACAP